MGRKRLTDPAVRRSRRTALYVIPVLLLMLSMARSAYAGQLENRHSAAPVQTEVPVQIQAAATHPPVQEISFRNVKVKREQTPRNVNILLIGSDDEENAGARSDTMILCTFNPAKDTIIMTSFLRDLYVQIPGYGKNRINAAYSYGGIELLNKTLQENFDVRVDGNIQVDFDCFEEIIDLLGGVTMELTSAEAAFVNRRIRGSALTEGTQQLTGAQALMYARDRYDTSGDFSRTNRQRKLLQALLETCKHKKLTQMLRLMRELVPMVKMDISKTDLTEYAMTLLPMLSDAEVRTQAIPISGGYRDAKIDGMYVLVPDLEKNRQALAESLE